MKEFLIYLSQSAICLSFFAVVYMFFLRRSTFFWFNRCFLLTGLLVSFILPLVKVKYDIIIPCVESTLPIVSSEGLLELAPVASSEIINIWILLGVVYIVGAVIVLGRNLFLWSKLNQYKKASHISIVQGCQVMEHPKVKVPFSVFTNIYLSDRGMQDVERGIIINHELKHIDQKHWMDLLCSECALMLQWFNPLMWYYIYLQKENHEYLADESVLADGESMAVYRAVLINQRFQGPIFSFSNSFNFSNQKNRLNMMKREKTSPWKKITALAVLPLCGAFIALSATPNYVVEKSPAYLELTNVGIIDDVIGFEGAALTGSSSGMVDEGLMETTQTKDPLKDYVIQFSAPPSAEQKWTFKEVFGKPFADINPLILIDNKEVSKSEMKLGYNEVGGISVYKSDTPEARKYGDKAKDGLIFLVTKEVAKNIRFLPPIKAARKAVSGKVVNSSGEPLIGVSVVLKGTSTGTVTDMDGRYALGTEINDPHLVFSYVGYEAVTLPANRVAIDVTLHKDVTTIEGRDSESLKDAIYVIDNQLSTAESFAQLPKDNIESISVLKSAEAVKGFLNEYNPVLAKQSEGKSVITIKTKEKSILDAISSNIYVLLNGKEVSRDDLGDVDPKGITNIDVFKPGNAKLLEYGDKAKDGAIFITTIKK